MKLFILFLFCIFLNYNSSLSSELSPTQKSSMIKLYHILCDSYYPDCPWGWNVNTDPCSWHGVACNNNNNNNNNNVTNSITQLRILDGEFNSSAFNIACQIESLEVLDISNTLIGSIRYDLFARCGRLPRLKSVTLSGDTICGHLPSFNDGFTKLESLNLSYNSFYGSVGAHFDGCHIKFLGVSNNLLSSIPSESSNMWGELLKLKYLDLSFNWISGPLPFFHKSFSNLQYLDLSYNSFSGSIGEKLNGLVSLRRLDLRSNNFTGSFPRIVNLTSLEEVRLSYNNFHGSISKQIGHFCANLTFLDLSNKLLQGTIPSEIGSCRKLSYLNLARNTLSGRLPMEIGNLKNLRELRLEHNLFHGNIPGEITQLYYLRTLDISWNSLSGSLPRNFSSLNSLTKLNLRNNNLAGEIPLMPTSLQYDLDVSNNLFEGPISQSLFSNMHYLRHLDLSNNRLFGPIPENIDTMSSLTTLDLSGNNLSGAIPLPFEFYWGLINLNLSYNLLSGSIPPSIQGFSYEAFIGNPNLCGQPLEISCPAVEKGSNSSQEHESKYDIYPGLFVSVAIGFYIGFWGVCGTLALKHSWRYALFSCVESIMNKLYVTLAIYSAKLKSTSHSSNE